MARPKGAKNPDYDDKRGKLVNDLADYALSSDLTRASLRQFAQAASVAEPTLRHYFGDRTGVVRAILEEIGRRAAPFIEIAAAPADTYAASLQGYVDLSLAGLKHGGFARAHAFGLIEGVADKELGAAYLTSLLEPSLAAIERRLAPFVDPGGDDPERTQMAALCLLSPMLIAAIHQRQLGGAETRKIDVPALFQKLAEVISGGFPEPAGEPRVREL
ncbi:MAG: hypothetical protein AAF527_01300 [Pseudomonadota bacterium]